MYAKLHGQGSQSVLAACDKELLGKKLEEGKISFIVSESFYGGRLVGKKELSEMMEESENINLVGKKCVEIALEKGLISEGNIIRIKGVPHAQVFKI
ncbi:MAG: DUF424 family protein [Candidatus Diapherotrites archaeon]